MTRQSRESVESRYESRRSPDLTLDCGFASVEMNHERHEEHENSFVPFVAFVVNTTDTLMRGERVTGQFRGDLPRECM